MRSVAAKSTATANELLRQQRDSAKVYIQRLQQDFANYLDTQKECPEFVATTIQMAAEINSTLKAFDLPFSWFARWRQVAELLKMDDNPEGPPTLDLDKSAGESDAKAVEELSDEILGQLGKSIAVLGNMGLGKETKRLFFVYDLLRPIVLHFQNTLFPLMRIEVVESEIVGMQGVRGFTKLMIKLENVFSLCVIVEANQYDIPRGRAQLFMEMWAAQEKSRRIDEFSSGEQKVCWGDVYGMVTTGQMFFPFCLDKHRKFTHAEGGSLNPTRPTVDEVKRLVQMIHAMITLGITTKHCE